MNEKHWILNLGADVKEHRFTLTINAPDTAMPVWHETKVVFLVKEGNLYAVCRLCLCTG